jgi:DNA polymerase III alpha subunit
LTKIAPDWKLLTKKEIVEKLFHLSNHADMVTRVKPKSVAELADCLALIRPSKKHLVPKYIQDRNDPELLEELYRKESKSDFRKSHAIPYALLIVIQLHLISADLL